MHTAARSATTRSRFDSFKPLVAFASASIGAALLALSIAGFDQIANTRTSTLDDATSFGCICFLGVCFGVLLTLAELNSSRFFFFFGFLRYRIGRACIFTVAGIMIGLIGKNLDHQCGCKSYVLLIVEGIACVGMAAVHVVAIVLLGNNTKPVALARPAATLSPLRSPVVQTVVPAQTPSSSSPAAAGSSLQPPPRSPSDVVVVVAAETGGSPATTTSRSENPNQPAWMNA